MVFLANLCFFTPYRDDCQSAEKLKTGSRTAHYIANYVYFCTCARSKHKVDPLVGTLLLSINRSQKKLTGNL